ncbi:MAG TPA: FKBP-type peptidyl-prolyl cis-trans isomerase [Pirellulales bacterium]|nr:FKBP-type peptidyl-prolyl cis-trans isomerase [Pirellulales bacterium]
MRSWHLKLAAAALLGLAVAEAGPVVLAAQPAGPTQPGPVDPDAPKTFNTTESGLKYRVLRKSKRSHPVKTDTVTVMYRGWLNDGTEFDSSYKTGKPISFRLDGVIKGWGEGVQLVGEGGMIELEIPPELGYGRQGIPGTIPPQATLHFIVELVRIR